jgi:LemA protein
MDMSLVIGILILFVLAGLTAYVITTYNILVRLSNNIKKAWSNIDVMLKQRHDELPKLVAVCNSYMVHERDTLEAVTKARAAYQGSVSIDEKAKAENRIMASLSQLLAVAEQYPDLKANQEFLHVQQRISSLEEAIADQREFYNDSVNMYNIAIQQIPAVWIAQQAGFDQRPLLEVPKTDREDVQLAFDNRAKSAA